MIDPRDPFPLSDRPSVQRRTRSETKDLRVASADATREPNNNNNNNIPFTMSTTELKRLKDRLSILGHRQKELEAKLMASYEALTSGGSKAPGLRGNLVDEEGFPRNDIDVHAVRALRHERACLQTDHQQVMKEIETSLHELHKIQQHLADTGVIEVEKYSKERDREFTETASKEDARGEDETEPMVSSDAFAEVRSVARGSPSHAAGLFEGDLIVAMGDVRASNHRNLSAVADLIRDNIGQTVSVLVLRTTTETGSERSPTRITLIPKRWNGPGLLGCHIVPFHGS